MSYHHKKPLTETQLEELRDNEHDGRLCRSGQCRLRATWMLIGQRRPLSGTGNHDTLDGLTTMTFCKRHADNVCKTGMVNYSIVGSLAFKKEETGNELIPTAIEFARIHIETATNPKGTK